MRRRLNCRYVRFGNGGTTAACLLPSAAWSVPSGPHGPPPVTTAGATEGDFVYAGQILASLDTAQPVRSNVAAAPR